MDPLLAYVIQIIQTDLDILIYRVSEDTLVNCVRTEIGLSR